MEALVVSPTVAAKKLCIAKAKIYPLLKSGEIKAYQDGPNWKIPVTSLQEYIERRCGQ